jgi:hypothetical protein
LKIIMVTITVNHGQFPAKNSWPAVAATAALRLDSA